MNFTRVMVRMTLLCAASSALSATVAHGSSTEPPESTERSDAALQALRLPDVRITSITRESTSSGELAYYDVEGVIGGTINFELLLPDAWNKRFVMGGGGGFVGSVQNTSRDTVRDGYATVGTDTGHQGDGFDASFALDDALAVVNFAHAAVHRTAEVAKAIMREHYGADPEYSYFIGCSRGGGQGMMASQRYPDDFDGIVAGAPAFDWSGLAATFLRPTQVFYPNPEVLDKTLVTREELDRLTAEVVALCDEQDGLKDGIISDPYSIEFSLDAIPWLSAEQREALQTIYDGARNQDGQIYPGMLPGSEMEWILWHVGPMPGFPVATGGHAFGVGSFKYFVFNDPEWDYSTYDFSTFAEDTRLAAATLDAVETDLSAFNASGGKLIIWHGLADGGLSPTASINYYDQLLTRDPNASDYSRLYLIPGCGHCGNGPGVSNVDWLDIIVEWVENGQAPDVIVATKPATVDAEEMSRPLSPYPQKTQYKGTGNPNSASSFESIAP